MSGYLDCPNALSHPGAQPNKLRTGRGLGLVEGKSYVPLIVSDSCQDPALQSYRDYSLGA